MGLLAHNSVCLLYIISVLGSLHFYEVGADCSGGTTLLNASTSNKELTSPNYPSNYYPNLSCRWLIRSSNSSHVIRVNIVDMNIESSYTCRYDYLLIYNGNSTNADVLGRFCGSSITSVSSGDNSILITFVSDWGVQGSGFKLKYLSAEFVETTTRPTTITMTTKSPSSNGSSETGDSRKIDIITGTILGSLFVLVVFVYFLRLALHAFKTKNSTNVNPSNNSYNQSYHTNNGHMDMCAPPPYEEHALPDSPPPAYEAIDPNRISNAAAVLRNMFNDTDRMGSRTRNHRRMSVECTSISGHIMDDSPRINNNISSFTNNNSPPFILVAPMATAASASNTPRRNIRPMDS